MMGPLWWANEAWKERKPRREWNWADGNTGSVLYKGGAKAIRSPAEYELNQQPSVAAIVPGNNWNWEILLRESNCMCSSSGSPLWYLWSGWSLRGHDGYLLSPSLERERERERLVEWATQISVWPRSLFFLCSAYLAHWLFLLVLQFRVSY